MLLGNLMQQAGQVVVAIVAVELNGRHRMVLQSVWWFGWSSILESYGCIVSIVADPLILDIIYMVGRWGHSFDERFLFALRVFPILFQEPLYTSAIFEDWYNICQLVYSS